MDDGRARAEVTGPVEGGSHGWAFGGPTVDFEQYGFRVDEFFLEGTAVRYRLQDGTSPSRDGKWAAEPCESAPFKTRFVVYRPTDPARFNGTVIVSWNNVSAGYDLFGGDSREILEGGYAFVGVTPQRVGVHGIAPMNLRASSTGTRSATARCRSRATTTRSTSSPRPPAPWAATAPRGEIDPMGGLDVQRVIAMGASQSAGRLGTYVNAIHPLTTRLRRIPAADLLRQRVAPRGRRRRREHRRAEHVGRHQRATAGEQPAPRRPRRPGDGGQLRARSDRLLRGAPARHRPVPVLGVGGHLSRLGTRPARPRAEVRARLRRTDAGDAGRSTACR